MPTRSEPKAPCGILREAQYARTSKPASAGVEHGANVLR